MCACLTTRFGHSHSVLALGTIMVHGLAPGHATGQPTKWPKDNAQNNHKHHGNSVAAVACASSDQFFAKGALYALAVSAEIAKDEQAVIGICANNLAHLLFGVVGSFRHLIHRDGYRIRHHNGIIINSLLC